MAPVEVGGDILEGTAMKAALKPPVAEGGTAVHGGGNRRDWFRGAGGRGATFIVMLPASGMSPSPS